MKKRAIHMNEMDDVSTVLDGVLAGEEVVITDKSGNETGVMTVLEDVPLYHKFALHDMKKHDFVHKYGEVIGEATVPIQKGTCVHVHNIASVKTRNHD